MNNHLKLRGLTAAAFAASAMFAAQPAAADVIEINIFGREAVLPTFNIPGRTGTMEAKFPD